MRSLPRGALFLTFLAASLALTLAQSPSGGAVPYLDGWKWIFYLGILVAFVDGYGIGANDVANSFATSVGSGSLTLKQAVMIGMVTEASGAILLGKNTSETIRGKIIDVQRFSGYPSVLALAMLCASIGSATFVLFATRQGWPISTTHAIVGAIMGVGIAIFGVDAVDWSFNGGMGGIIASWFISPVFAGLIAVVIWKFTENVVLKAADSFETALRWIPAYFFATITFISLFMLYKGIPSLDVATQLGDAWAVGISVGLGVLAALLAYKFYVPWIRARTERTFAAGNNADPHDVAVELGGAAGGGDVGKDGLSASLLSAQEKEQKEPRAVTETTKLNGLPHSDDAPVKAEPTKPWSELSFAEKAVQAVTRGVNVDVVSHPELSAMHALVTKYDRKTEILYSALQILTASFASFAHGSNDIANAVGPLSTIYAVYSSDWQQTVSANTSTPIWVVLVCTAGLDIGLLTYGYNIMRELGNKITYHSPARGFCMEFAAGFAVLTASKLGLPVSTTHCITGATLAVGLCSGDVNAVNWRRSLVYLLAWMVCVPVSGLVAGLVFSLISFSPKAYVQSGGGLVPI